MEIFLGELAYKSKLLSIYQVILQNGAAIFPLFAGKPLSDNLKMLKLCDMASMNPTILVVDDEPDILTLIEISLKMSRFEVVTALNGTDAFALMQKMLPALILLDVMMPGMSGFEVCQRIKENPRLKQIPVVFLTAKGQKGDIDKGLGLGAADYIVKPFDPYELGNRLKRILEKI